MAKQNNWQNTKYENTRDTLKNHENGFKQIAISNDQMTTQRQSIKTTTMKETCNMTLWSPFLANTIQNYC